VVGSLFLLELWRVIRAREEGAVEGRSEFNETQEELPVSTGEK
jgi:hypothetical protein